ncbi:MAG: DUF5694 domain-containing protein [Rhodothermales bacterium]
MRQVLTLVLMLTATPTAATYAQPNAGATAPSSTRTPVLTLGVFHFEYPNLDAVTTNEEDQISVLDEPYQTEIRNLVASLQTFRPTLIAVEELPAKQHEIDSLYAAYLAGRMELHRTEVHQLGFRLGKLLGLEKIHAVDDAGRHYPNLTEIFADSSRRARFERYYLNSPDTVYAPERTAGRVTSIVDALEHANDPDAVKAELGMYLLRQFKYEETDGDFTGVDFETGRWFNRNLRIFRNVQRLPRTADDRVLLVIGSGHLNLLNYLFDVSKEFDLVSPLPYLQNARAPVEVTRDE